MFYVAHRSGIVATVLALAGIRKRRRNSRGNYPRTYPPSFPASLRIVGTGRLEGLGWGGLRVVRTQKGWVGRAARFPLATPHYSRQSHAGYVNLSSNTRSSPKGRQRFNPLHMFLLLQQLMVSLVHPLLHVPETVKARCAYLADTVAPTPADA